MDRHEANRVKGLSSGARRRLLLGAGALAAVPRAVFAQGFPERPITLFCPWIAGGSSDIAMRALADAASKHFPRRVVIENKPGAGGVLGAVALTTTAKPDGHTLSQVPLGVFRFPYMQRTSFNSLTDLTWILCIAGYLFASSVRADSPWKTWAELIAFAKANPGRLSYGSPGVGTSLHLTMEDIAQREGIQWLHVPYKGNSEALTALRQGDVQIYASGVPWELVEAGQVRTLAIWTEKRSPRVPDVPTLTERGYGIVANSPWGICGPKGMAPAVVRIVHDGFRKAMEDAGFVATLARLGMTPLYMSGEDYLRWAVKAEAYERAAVERLGLGAK